jgi:hypothetical protein
MQQKFAPAPRASSVPVLRRYLQTPTTSPAMLIRASQASLTAKESKVNKVKHSKSNKATQSRATQSKTT